MGIRCTQFLGLSPKAKAYIDSFGFYKVRVAEYLQLDEGDEILLSEKFVSRHVVDAKPSNRFALGMFEDEKIPLMDFTLPGGTVLHEKVQYETWSSGPVIATALYDNNDNLVVGWDYQEYLSEV